MIKRIAAVAILFLCVGAASAATYNGVDSQPVRTVGDTAKGSLKNVLENASQGTPEAILEEKATIELKKLLGPLTSVSAEFNQKLYSVDDYLIQDSSGHMKVSKPGKIRWVLDSPMEQWLISDGVTLWLYDPDLEQVVIRAFNPDVTATPALLFTGSVSELATAFRVRESKSEVANPTTAELESPSDPVFDQATNTNYRSFTLIPRNNQTLYESLTFEFYGDKPQAITIADALGQRTKITFSNVVLNKAIDPVLYSFEPPPGIDVIRDD